MDTSQQDMSNGRAGGQQGGSSGTDEYSAFAQGIAMNRPPPSSISFQHPFPHRSSSSSGHASQGYAPQPSPHQHNLQLAPSAGPSRSPGKGKGKSPAVQTSSLQQGGSQQDGNGQDGQNVDNGLTLDPDAFSRDIRFQVPSFLSNQMTGAPSFPAGGEAWSGFNANMFQDGGGNGSGGGQLTPGTIFNNAFGLNESNNYGNEQSGGGRNVLDGLSGFMGDGQWDGWDNKFDAGGNNGMTNTNGNSAQASTTFYVNPNPSPNVLAQRTQQVQQQQQQPQTQPTQPPPHQHPHQSQQSHGQQRPTVTSINTSQQQSSVVNQSPRTAHPGQIPSPRNTTMPPLHTRSSTMPSPQSANPSSMPPSAIFPQNPQTIAFYGSSTPTPTMPSASTVNIASSSTQPYAPPANTSALLSGPAMPGIVGPSLSDGPGLYSTTGFDMVGVLSRVAARKDPKTVLGPVDLSCSFLVVVSWSRGSSIATLTLRMSDVMIRPLSTQVQPSWL